MWFLLLCLLLSTGCSQRMAQPESAPSASATAFSLEAALRQHFPLLDQFQSANWPPDSDRLSGQLQWVSLRIPQSSAQDGPESLKEALRNALHPLVVAQGHPESDCIAVQVQQQNGFWLLRAEIVCR